jgi:type 1 glutamine amidotransferase
MQTILSFKNYRLIAGLIFICLLSSFNTAYSKTKSIRVLIVGGGISHDFDRWYKQADAATLSRGGLCMVTYTSNTDSIAVYLKNTDVLYLVTNQPINAENRAAIFAFVNAGKGLVLGHPALWYNWKDWPEYNQQLVSGGASDHDRYGSFTEEIINPNHPVTKGVDQQFILKDERYHYIPDSAGPGIELLANNHVAGSDMVYPSVFVVKNSKARIVCIALGHDAESHDIVPYQTILRNAVKWVAHQ